MIPSIFSNPISMKLELPNKQTGKTTNYVEVKKQVGQERNQGENFKNTLRQMKMEIPHSKIDETQQKQL